MKKVDMTISDLRSTYKAEIDKLFGDNSFTKEEAKEAVISSGLDKSKWAGLSQLLKKYCSTDEKDVYTFKDRCGSQSVVKEKKEAVKKEVKKTIQKDWEVIAEKDVPIKVVNNEHMHNQETQPAVLQMAKLKSSIVNLVPKKDPQYVAWGHFKDIKTILESKIFYPIFVTGLSGNGKTSMIREVCAKLKRDMVRVNITVETDEDDLLGGFRLVNGETVWQDGPLVVAMKTGAVALIDEVDLASHKIMCLQPIMEGQPIYLKKINEVVYPADGFNIVATANTKGKGSSDGRFMGTNILNEAFLDRFAATFYQEYPTVQSETKILKKQFALKEMNEDDFVDKLVKWADVIRRSFKEGAVDEIITTRRLIDIVKTHSIFNNKMKAITLCLERFDDETKESFADLYTKVDAGASFEDIAAEAGVTAEEEENTEEVPF